MKILVIAEADPEKRSTWSGVPSQIVRELRRQGHVVVGRAYESVWWTVPFRLFYNRVVRSLVPRWNWRMFACTRLGVYLYSLWLRFVCRRIKPDLVIALSFGFDAGIVGYPVVLVHDWSNGYLTALFHRREVLKDERKFDEVVFRAMRKARKVVALYPLSAQYIASQADDVKVAFVCNPVNVAEEVDVAASIEKGVLSKHVLVVGGATYQPNVETVIQAADMLGDPDVVVDVVGRTCAASRSSCCQVNFYGYLNQDMPDDKELYARLFREARCFVNVCCGWCGGSSIAESLYRGVPVIVSPQAEIRALYPLTQECEAEKPSALARALSNFFAMPADQYRDLCWQGATAVKGDTYERLVRELLTA